MKNNIDLNAMAKESYEIAVDKGWWESPRSESAMHLLMNSELSEALEDFRAHKDFKEVWLEENGKPCGIPIELADFVIRIGDYAAKNGVSLDADGLPPIPQEAQQNFEDALMCASYCVDRSWAFLTWADHDHDNFDQAYWLTRACDYIIAICDTLDIDLDAAIKQKMLYNRERKHRHGGKKI